MPLAPLFATLIENRLAVLEPRERTEKLTEAADAFVKVRAEMRSLSAVDPAVAALRTQAQEQLSLGAIETALAHFDQAAAIDAASRQALTDNRATRTLSEATTLYLAGAAASADLRFKRAIPPLRQAAALFRELDEPAMTDTDRLRRLNALELLGEALMREHTGTAEAEALFAEHMRIASARAAANSGDPVWQRQLAISHGLTASVQFRRGASANAVRSRQAAVALLEKVVAAEPGSVELQKELAWARSEVGEYAFWAGDGDLSVAAFRSGLTIYGKLLAAHPDDLWFVRINASMHDRLGGVLRAANRLDEALAAYISARELWLRVQQLSEHKWDQGGARSILTKIAAVMEEKGDLAGALDTEIAYLSELRLAADTTPDDWGNQISIADVHMDIGDLQVKMRRLDAALESFRTAKALADAGLKRNAADFYFHRILAKSLQRMGEVLTAKRDRAGTLSAYRASHAALVDLVAGHGYNVDAKWDLFVVCWRLAEIESGKVAYLRQGIAALEVLQAEGRLNENRTRWLERARAELRKVEKKKKT
jgi:tetratricopeptide (TPR) repeat protein